MNSRVKVKNKLNEAVALEASVPYICVHGVEAMVTWLRSTRALVSCAPCRTRERVVLEPIWVAMNVSVIPALHNSIVAMMPFTHSPAHSQSSRDLRL